MYSDLFFRIQFINVYKFPIIRYYFTFKNKTVILYNIVVVTPSSYQTDSVIFIFLTFYISYYSIQILK